MTDQERSVRDIYLEQMVESSSPEGLIILLVDGAVNFISRALIALEKGKLDDVNLNLIKAQNIYLELVITLDMDAGEFANNLGLVYQYIYNLLIEANLDKDDAKIRTCLRLAEQIRGLWKETLHKAQTEPAGEFPSRPAPVTIDSKEIKKTGVYEPAGLAGLAEHRLTDENAPSRLNITG